MGGQSPIDSEEETEEEEEEMSPGPIFRKPILKGASLDLARKFDESGSTSRGYPALFREIDKTLYPETTRTRNETKKMMTFQDLTHDPWAVASDTDDEFSKMGLHDDEYIEEENEEYMSEQTVEDIEDDEDDFYVNEDRLNHELFALEWDGVDYTDPSFELNPEEDEIEV